MFRAVTLIQNTDLNKHSYSKYSIGFDSRFLSKIWGKNAVAFGVDHSSSVHIDNERKDILVVGDGVTQGLDNTLLKEEAKYSINFSRSGRKFP